MSHNLFLMLQQVYNLPWGEPNKTVSIELRIEWNWLDSELHYVQSIENIN